MWTQNDVYAIGRHYISDWADDIPTELLNKLLGWLRSRNLAELSSCSSLADGTSYSVSLMRHLLQLEAFFKKNVIFSQEERCARAAEAAFHRAEKLCRITNRRLDYYHGHQERLSPELARWIPRMERYIQRVLGAFDRADCSHEGQENFLDRLPSLVRVTSGASATRGRRDSLPHLKLRTRNIVVTPRSRPLVNAMMAHFGYPKCSFKVINWNRVEVVPKSWKTYRTMACEPEGVMPFQLAVDSHVKDRLRKFGIDLSDQSVNQKMAWHGSVTGYYTTADLSMASDTEAYNTVAWLFPHKWFDYLDRVRSTSYKGPFGIGTYAKFSSMGNGTTFTTETLIFASACHAVGSKSFTVYGDDIVIETALFEDLQKVLRFFGFVINTSKSHSQGPFRESCGANWYLGRDVTPIYLRNGGELRPEACHAVNGLASIALPDGNLWAFLAATVRNNKLPLVPYNYDTMSGVHVDIPTAYRLKKIRVKRGLQKYLTFVNKSDNLKETASQTLALWHLDAALRPDFVPGIKLVTNSKAHNKVPINTRNPEMRFSRIARSSAKDDLARIRSLVPQTTHRFARKWVCWFPPAQATPVHLYLWTDTLTRA